MPLPAALPHRPFGGQGPDLGPFLAGSRRDQAFTALSHYPAAAMDLAFVLDDSVPAAAVLATVRSAGGELLEDARLFDEFRSDALGAGRRSLAIAVRFRAPDRTLKDEEITKVRNACITAVAKVHGGELRS